MPKKKKVEEKEDFENPVGCTEETMEREKKKKMKLRGGDGATVAAVPVNVRGNASEEQMKNSFAFLNQNMPLVLNGSNHVSLRGDKNSTVGILALNIGDTTPNTPILLTELSKQVKTELEPLFQPGRINLQKFEKLLLEANISEKEKELVQKALYAKKDRRRDCYQITDPKIQKNIWATVGLWEVKSLSDNHDGYTTLQTERLCDCYHQFGSGKPFVKNLPFADQPIGPVGSGVLISADMVATAYHNIEGGIDDIRFVFGFRLDNKKSDLKVVPTTDIFQGTLIASNKAQDWALIKLDKCPNYPPVTCFGTGVIGNDVYALGYGLGLPLKYSPGKLTHVGTKSFTASVDCFVGNSGSPIFNTNHELMGILSTGSEDFEDSLPNFQRLSKYLSSSNSGETFVYFPFVK